MSLFSDRVFYFSKKHFFKKTFPNLYKKGFTLIELLVVIAIIGVLTSVVLASLTSAKNKARDTATKSGLSTLRSQAELYNTVSGSYRGAVNAIGATQSQLVCQTAGTVFNTTDGIGGKIEQISNQIDPAEWQATCALGDTPDSWAISMPLMQGGAWCVNYQGIAKIGVATGGGPGGDAICQ
jgi:prepilin-type N-terminal cleavage/methylation domain-containing protein